MSTEMILGAIGTLLGVANFVYWAWLSKREKVAVVIHPGYVGFVHKGEEAIGPGQKLTTVNKHSLHIYVSCALVLTSGETELEVMEVEIQLHKETCEELRKYFQIPTHNRFYLYKYELDSNGYRNLGTVLQPKKPVDFTEDRLFECTAEFEEEYDKIKNGSHPEFIQPLLDELETKYQICWTRYDGKELCWKFPKKWWRNLGKRLWG